MVGTPQQEALAEAAITSDIGYNLGVHFCALVWDSVLVGIIVCQLTHWFPEARNDTRSVRFLIGIAATVTAIAGVFTWAMYMFDYVFNYGTYFQFVDFKLLGSYGLLNVCIVIPVQLIFADRAIKINGNSEIVAAGTYSLAAATFAGGLGFFITTRGQSLLAVPSIVVRFIQYWPTICSIAHIFCTACIIHGLWKARSGNERSNRLIERLIRGCLEAQIPGTLYSIIGLVLVCANPGSPLIPFILVTHPKVYLAGALAMVNSRHTWGRKGVTPEPKTDMSATSVETPTVETLGKSSKPSTWGLEVETGLTEDHDVNQLETESETRLSFQRPKSWGQPG